jgi:thiamine-phosphate pyrophosphorylase
VTPHLDRFYPIVENAAWVERLVGLGAQLIQLRMKDQPPDVVRENVRAARLVCERAGAQLVVNDYWQIAIEEACDFVHLGQEDLERADLAAIRSAGMRLGVSSHDYAELDRALSTEPAYVALGPIYPTLLKKMKWAPQGLARLAEWKQLVGAIPLVAIGGLTVERLPQIFDAGADVAAVVTDIVRSSDPAARTREWITATRAVH